MSSFATAILALLLMPTLMLAGELVAGVPALVPEPAAYGEQLSPGSEALTPSSFGNFDDATATGSFGNPAERMAPSSFGNYWREEWGWEPNYRTNVDCESIPDR